MMKYPTTRAVTALFAATASILTLSALPASAAPPVGASATVSATSPSTGSEGNLLGALLGLLGASPSLAWSPTTGDGSYDYGPVDPGTTRSTTFTLRNSGKGGSSALSVDLTGSSAFVITGNTCARKSLGPKKACTVTVRYAPSASGATDTATLAATSKLPKAGATITLTGTAQVADPHFASSSRFDLEAVFTRFCVVTVTVTNLPAGTYHLVYNKPDGSVYDRGTFSSSGPEDVHTQTEGTIPEGTVWRAQVLLESTQQPFGPQSEPIVVSC